MGNCCSGGEGKGSSSNFQGEGRTLGAQPATAPPRSDNARAAAPSNMGNPKGGEAQSKDAPSGQDPDGPKAAAARAAEKRARASQSGSKGKLGRQLDAQRSQTQTQTLVQNAQDNIATRNADANAAARNWD
ncbi:hypothetical protein M433DRAFT_160338 [Acidomyces richmondensis BFW]|nr:hypothetical protein M433DRAFT_160338 [Acidomyces richmondensis BFW]